MERLGGELILLPAWLERVLIRKVSCSFLILIDLSELFLLDLLSVKRWWGNYSTDNKSPLESATHEAKSNDTGEHELKIQYIG